MTRLGESPNGWLFSFGSFIEIAEVAHILGLLFQLLRLCINFGKNVLG
jgi:hypothetical protein